MLNPLIPEPANVLSVGMEDGATIILRQYGETSKSRIILSHGNGFAIDGYVPYWALLLADFEVVIFDFRNYGRNPVHDGEHDYKRFYSDMGVLYDAIQREFGPKPQAGVFHSMSARVNLNLALKGHRHVDGMIVFDPPMVPIPGHPLRQCLMNEEELLWRWSAGRPESFEDPSELAATFAKSRMLSGWVEGAYDRMARSVLREDLDAGLWRLVCSPSRESHIYRQNADLNIWPFAHELPFPVLLVGGDPETHRPSAPSFACQALGKERGWRYEYVPDTNHFAQLQKPEACIKLTHEFLSEIDLF